MSAADLIAALGAAVPDAQYQALESRDSDVTPTILAPASRLLATCLALRDSPGLEFKAFSDVTAVDFHPDREPRFDLVYHLVSPHRRARVRVKIRVGNDEPVASITPVWHAAGWMEREVYDLFGIDFVDHPDMTRILMPDDWDGHPLRKDDHPAHVPVTFKEDPRPS